MFCDDASKEEGEGEVINQATNRIPYGLLTEEEKGQFCVEAKRKGLYEFYMEGDWVNANPKMDRFDKETVYRLKIEPEEWYYIERTKGDEPSVLKGESIGCVKHCYCVRPAKDEEIPKPEKTLKERIKEEWPDYEVVRILPDNDGYLRMPDKGHNTHIVAQSMKGFYRYVYDIEGELIVSFTPIKPHLSIKVLYPLAVLFEKEVQP